ncbi:hypothetical protein TKK_0017884 [Trichogramma kaykai]|uniref:C2H2-type domain-containing protein n=1 Tax=Trichogramma kaykai TaxID=54128 RepID=A0ABD2W0Z8_9HYME
MNETVEQLMVSKDAQERCSKWIDQIDPLLLVTNNSKHKLEDDGESIVETDSEFDSVSECGAKRRKIAVKLKAETLNLSCQWRDCTFSEKSLDNFIKHVSYHIPEVEYKEISDDIGNYCCLWDGCEYQCDKDVQIMRHVNYHAFHTKIKSLGTNIRGRIKLPKCRRDTDWKNIIESLPDHKCQWHSCTAKDFTNYNYFLYHVQSHAENNPRGNKIAGGIKCLWESCKCSFPSLYKLKEHLRTHTKERIVACPDCGTMFASNSKFHEHCKRQIPLEVQGFQCSHCNKYYPTENILREHMRNHIFHYKCSMCDMTCESPSGLAKHVLYRHTEERNFPCSVCSHRAKSQQDLDSHMNLHGPSSNFTCTYEGCSYACKNAYTLDRHIEKVHRLEIRWYCCHECPIKYRKSYRLTRHLIEDHHLQWLSGHKRFQYILEDDGCYRLQTVRYESIDENNTTAKDNPPAKADVDKETVANQEVYQVVIENTDYSKSMPNIVISIGEIDEHGNIIENKYIETQETTELPPSAGPPIILT